jgi:ATP-binding cassette subfamily F protein 3
LASHAQRARGFVGANGSGKTTLLRILAGLEGLDGGSVSKMKGITIGYLPQDGLSLSGRSVFDECMTVFDELHAMEKEQEALAHKMSEMIRPAPSTRRFPSGSIASRANFTRGWLCAGISRGRGVSGLGFPPGIGLAAPKFSGGWQMRIALAALLEKPNLLLLDEPTNHLDLEARNWLEEYLSAHPNAFVLISHDRYFLDVTVKKIAHLWNKRVTFYTGGFTKFEELKTERLAQLQAAANNQRDRIEQLEAFINRFRAQATKAKQVQSRIKELEKIERIEIPPEEKTIHIRFPQPKPSGRIVAEFKGVSKSYGPKHVFSGAKLRDRARRPHRAGGRERRGKSTLIKILAGAEPVTAGEYTLGHNAQPDYFAQDQYKELNPTSICSDDLGRRAARHQYSVARRARLFPVLRGRCVQAHWSALGW